MLTLEDVYHTPIWKTLVVLLFFLMYKIYILKPLPFWEVKHGRVHEKQQFV